MGQISLSIPQTGLPNSTEDVKVASDLTAIQTLLNGNLDSTNLSPSAGITQGQLAAGSSSSFGFSNVATSQSTSSTTFTALGTSDIVNGIVLPANGLIQVWFSATWQESAWGAAQAALFLGANQLRVAGSTQAAVTQVSGGTANQNHYLFSTPAGLASTSSNPGYSGDVTTGQAVGSPGLSGSANQVWMQNSLAGSFGSSGLFGGSCDIFAAAGTYNVGVQFKTGSGTVTASNRKLWVRTLLFA